MNLDELIIGVSSMLSIGGALLLSIIFDNSTVYIVFLSVSAQITSLYTAFYKNRVRGPDIQLTHIKTSESIPVKESGMVMYLFTGFIYNIGDTITRMIIDNIEIVDTFSGIVVSDVTQSYWRVGSGGQEPVPKDQGHVISPADDFVFQLRHQLELTNKTFSLRIKLTYFDQYAAVKQTVIEEELNTHL